MTFKSLIGLIQIGIDTVTSDTIYISKNEFKRISKIGVLIEHLTYVDEFSNFTDSYSCNDDSEYLSGYYNRYYNSGKLRETGNLRCGFKTDEWFEFYEGGNIKTYANYLKLEAPYYTSRQQGLYKEYHENGQTKLRGQYQIFKRRGTFKIFDPETYEERDSCCTWKLISKKISNWTEFDSTGVIVNETKFAVDLKNEKLLNYPDNLKPDKNGLNIKGY